MKRCVRISDSTGVRDIVSLLGDRALSSEWRAHDVWTVQEGDDCAFEDLCSQNRRISGGEFVSALKRVTQVIDGRFEAFEVGATKPWATIESIDSSFHLLHGDATLLAAACARFKSVSENDPPETPWRRRNRSGEPCPDTHR